MTDWTRPSQLSDSGDYCLMVGSRDRQSDSDLVRASVDDPGAFEVLFARHASGLRAWLAAQVKDVGVANELLAETFAQAWQSRHRFKGVDPDDGLAWIYGIARNLLRRHYKRGRVEARGRQRLRMRVDLIEDDRAEEVEARLTASGLRPRITSELSALPEFQQRAVDARIVRELDYGSVAAELECSEPTARALVSRGLRRLKETLNGALL
jgi:RNA polymerase sigma factor (sigma-70 family)